MLHPCGFLKSIAFFFKMGKLEEADSRWWQLALSSFHGNLTDLQGGNEEMWGQGGNMRTRWWTTPWRWTTKLWWWTTLWRCTTLWWWTTPSRWTTQYLYNWQLCHRVDWQTKIWPNGENTQKNCLSFHVSFVFLLLMLLLDGKQFNKYLYFGRSLYCFILTFYNIEAVEDFLGASQTEVKKSLG